VRWSRRYGKAEAWKIWRYEARIVAALTFDEESSPWIDPHLGRFPLGRFPRPMSRIYRWLRPHRLWWRGMRQSGLNCYPLQPARRCGAFVSEADNLRIQNLGKNFQRLHDARPGGFEELCPFSSDTFAPRTARSNADCRLGREVPRALASSEIRAQTLSVLAILICLYSAMTNRMKITSRMVTVSNNKEYC
jgi:hypothetical protein